MGVIIHGDCREALLGLPAESVDAVVTDPPYELGFMGNAWDSTGVAYDVEMWRECLRVLKPGGHLLAFGGTRTWHRLAVAIEDAGFQMRDSIAWLHGQGFPKGKNLKPAFEPVVVARKRTSTAGAGLNIDACRIPTTDSFGGGAKGSSGFVSGYDGSGWAAGNAGGRWPANAILDESTAVEMDRQSGHLHGSGNKSDTGTGGDAKYEASSYHMAYKGRANRDYASQGGGASRFFYVAKASKRERPIAEGITHATVKPLALMTHLVRMVARPGDVVLDPFAGSGTTVEACVAEGIDYIGIEQNADYLPLIQHRLDRQAGTLAVI